MPYFLAPLWDAELAKRREAEEAARRARKAHGGEKIDKDVGRVPKELRERLKRAKAAKPMLMELEEEVRRFVRGWEGRRERLESEGLGDADSDEEEIVFVGRGGAMSDMPPSPKRGGNKEEVVGKEKLLFDSPVDDQGAGFGYVALPCSFLCSRPWLMCDRRWLVHSIASYYGLRTWSVTVGNPARREAYVGIKQMKTGKGTGKEMMKMELPRPLYGLV